MNSIIPDKYDIIAKILPTYLSCIPILFFLLKYTGSLSVLKEINTVGILFGNITIYFAISYFFTSVIRGLGKNIEHYFFKWEKDFPTTLFLLYSNSEFSEKFKILVREKIEQLFNLVLLTREEENNDIDEAKKLIKESVSLIRNKVGNGNLLLNYNIQYGFFRNIIGGSIIGCLVSIIYIICFGTNDIYSKWVASVGSVYVFLLLFHKNILRFYAKMYAKRLYEEFISLT